MRNHLSHLYDKLDLHGRAAAIAYVHAPHPAGGTVAQSSSNRGMLGSRWSLTLRSFA